MPLESKLPNVGTTIFTVMSKLAADEGAINLSQGYPDFDGPPELLERVGYYLTHGYNQYPPMAGIEPLRDAIAGKVADLYGVEVNPETEVTVTSGATEALFCAINAVVRPGDEVIVFDPCYDSYEPAVTLAGGVCRHLPLCAPDFHVDWDRVHDAVGPKTRLVIVNTPHNPTGAVWNEDDIAGLRSVMARGDIYVVGDEVYEHILFDGRTHVSLCRYPDLFARSFVVSSFGKTYHTTGWKVAYCVAPAGLSAEFRRVHQFVTFTTATPLQYGIADFLKSCPEHHEKPRRLLPGQARPVLRPARQLQIPPDAVRGHLLPACRLRADLQRTGRRTRTALDGGEEGRLHPDLGLLRGASDPDLPALLLCEGRRHARTGRRDAMRTLNVALVQADLHWHDPAANRAYVRRLTPRGRCGPHRASGNAEHGVHDGVRGRCRDDAAATPWPGCATSPRESARPLPAAS